MLSTFQVLDTSKKNLTHLSVLYLASSLYFDLKTASPKAHLGLEPEAFSQSFHEQEMSVCKSPAMLSTFQVLDTSKKNLTHLSVLYLASSLYFDLNCLLVRPHQTFQSICHESRSQFL